MADLRYGRHVVGVAIDRRLVTAGDLREPIALLHSVRAPDNATGFTKTLTCYAKPFAKVRWAMTRPQEGANADPVMRHYFTIRHPGFEPAITDFVSWGNKLFAVQNSQVLGNRMDFLSIATQQVENSDSVAFQQDPEAITIATPAPANETTNDAQNPFW